MASVSKFSIFVAMSVLVCLLIAGASSQRGSNADEQQQRQQQRQQQQRQLQPLRGRVEGVASKNIDMLFEDWRAWVIIFQHGASVSNVVSDLATENIGFIRIGVVDVDSKEYDFDALSKRLVCAMPTTPTPTTLNNVSRIPINYLLVSHPALLYCTMLSVGGGVG
jgi:hypothetical protein